jgi:hypothetical protein
MGAGFEMIFTHILGYFIIFLFPQITIPVTGGVAAFSVMQLCVLVFSDKSKTVAALDKFSNSTPYGPDAINLAVKLYLFLGFSLGILSGCFLLMNSFYLSMCAGFMALNILIYEKMHIQFYLKNQKNT